MAEKISTTAGKREERRAQWVLTKAWQVGDEDAEEHPGVAGARQESQSPCLVPALEDDHIAASSISELTPAVGSSRMEHQQVH